MPKKFLFYFSSYLDNVVIMFFMASRCIRQRDPEGAPRCNFMITWNIILTWCEFLTHWLFLLASRCVPHTERIQNSGNLVLRNFRFQLLVGGGSVWGISTLIEEKNYKNEIFFNIIKSTRNKVHTMTSKI